MSEHPRQVLILFAHPALQKSRVNRRLRQEVMDLPGVTFHDLYEAYPQLDVDAAREQALLEAHDVVVLQHPFFWYSTPAILKEWQDLVLEHGWAYGREGTRLHGKWLLNAMSAGGREVAYQPDGYNRFTIRQLLAPIEQTAHLCGMTYLPPFVVHGTHTLSDAQLDADAAAYRRAIEALRDDRIDLEALARHPRLNSDLDAVLRDPPAADGGGEG